MEGVGSDWPVVAPLRGVGDDVHISPFVTLLLAIYNTALNIVLEVPSEGPGSIKDARST